MGQAKRGNHPFSAAMQNQKCCYANKSVAVASGIHRLAADNDAATGRFPRKGTQMSKTAAIGFAPSANLFGRLMAAIDRLLTSSARIAVRNGDLPRFGI
jgi:hypothetical protein